MMGGVINGFPTDVGRILVMMGACSEEQLKHASRKSETPDVSRALMESGAVSREDVVEAERLRESLVSAKDEMPVMALVRLYEHAVGNYHRSTVRLSEALESLSRR